MIKKTILILTLSLFSIPGIQAQSNTVSIGGEATGSGGSGSFTAGEVFYSYKTAGSSVTEGVQQGYSQKSAPTAVAQTFCSSATVADLAATGTDIQWYDTATEGSVLTTSTVLTSGTYYASQTFNGIESSRTAVVVTINPLSTIITCPANIIVSNTIGECGAIVEFEASATGTPSPTITYSQASGSYFAIGTTIVTVTATSSCDAPTQTFTVTVNDTEAPIIACAENITVSYTGPITLTPPTATDNCNGNGNALNFDGGYVDVPDNAALNPINQWTIETWVKSTTSGIQQAILEKYAGGGQNIGYLVRILSNNKILAGPVIGISSGSYVNSTTVILPNVWYHVACTLNKNSGDLKLYINGVLENAIKVGSLPVVPNTTSLKIGARGNDANVRLVNGGMLSEVRIWNTERSQAQIHDNMNKEINIQSGLVASYPLNQGVASADNATVISATDTSGYGNNGNLTNFTLNSSRSNWVPANRATGPTISNDAPASYPVGTTTVTWTATDSSGNTSSCEQTVTVTPQPAQPTVAFTIKNSSPIIKVAQKMPIITKFSVIVYPNSFSSNFKLGVTTTSLERVNVSVYDVTGRLIEQRNTDVSEIANQEIGNDYPSGVYNIIVNQGSDSKTLRVIKKY